MAIWEALAKVPQLATAMSNLAKLYVSRAQVDRAEPLCRRALEIQARALGNTEAESLYRRSLEIEEKTLGPDHAEVFKTLSNFAQTCHLEGRVQDAEPLYVRALKIAEHSLGAAHPDALATMSNYAAVLRELHRKEEARRRF